MARGGFHHHRSSSGTGGGGVSVASSSGHHHHHQSLSVGGRNNHASERETSASNSTTTAVSGSNGLLWNYTTTTTNNNNVSNADGNATTSALNTSTTTAPTIGTRKGDLSQLLSRGYTGRYLGAVLVPYGTVTALSNDEVERDLLHINAYATAAARYHQIQYVAINRVNQPPNTAGAPPPATTSGNNATANGQGGEKDGGGAANADTTTAVPDGAPPVGVSAAVAPPTLSQSPVPIGPIASSSPFYPPPPPIHSMAMMLPVRIDPEEEKRNMALRKKIARAEMIREELEQQYDALCKHCAVTVHKLQSFSKHSAGNIRFLQGHVLQQSSLLAIQRARLQMVRDAMATVRVREEAILEWRQKYAYQHYNPTGPQPPSTEELDRLGAIEDGCPLLAVWNDLERVHLEKALTIAAKATAVSSNAAAAAAASSSTGPSVATTTDGTKPNNATSMDANSDANQDSGRDDSESNNRDGANAEGADGDVVMKDASQDGPESVNLPLKLKKARKRNSKTDDGSLADTESNISDDNNNNNNPMNDDTSSNNNHTRHNKKHGGGKKQGKTTTPEITNEGEANLMVWPCTVQPATARGMPILVSAMSLAPERTIAVSTANMFGSSNHSLLYTERFLPELHSSNIKLLSKSGIVGKASTTASETTLLRRASTALSEITDQEQQHAVNRLSPVPSLVEDEHPARKDPMEIKSFSDLPDHILKLEEEAAALQNQLDHEEELNRDILAKTCKARVANDEWVAMMALIRQETESILHRHNILLESEEAIEANARLMLLEQQQIEERLQNQHDEDEDEEEDEDDEEDEEVRQYANGVIQDGDEEEDEIEEDDDDKEDDEDEEGEVDEEDDEGEIDEDDHAEEGEIVGEDDDEHDDDEAEEGEIVEDYAAVVVTDEDQTTHNFANVENDRQDDAATKPPPSAPAAASSSKSASTGTNQPEAEDDIDATAQAIAALTGFASIASNFAAAAKAASSTATNNPDVGQETTTESVGIAASTLSRPLPVHHHHHGNDSDDDDEEEGYIDESKDDDNIQQQQQQTSGIKRDHTSVHNAHDDDDDDDEEEGEIKDDDYDDDTGPPQVKRHKV